MTAETVEGIGQAVVGGGIAIVLREAYAYFSKWLDNKQQRRESESAGQRQSRVDTIAEQGELIERLSNRVADLERQRDEGERACNERVEAVDRRGRERADALQRQLNEEIRARLQAEARLEAMMGGRPVADVHTPVPPPRGDKT